MKLLRNLFVSGGSGALALCALLILAGCETLDGGAAGPGAVGSGPAGLDKNPLQDESVIRVGETITIEMLDITPEKKIEQTVQPDGDITLPLGVRVKAFGKTNIQLAKEIEESFVPKYYHRLTVNIKREGRYFFVGGYVKNASQRAYTGDMTVLKAIAAASGFTEFANQKKVQITRTDGRKQTVDCVKALKNPKLDLPVYPGDSIYVPQRRY